VSCPNFGARRDYTQGVVKRYSLLALSQDKFLFVLSWIDKVFPHDLDGYSAKALCARLLSTISLSLLFFQFPDRDDLPLDLNMSHQYVVLSNPVLQALSDVIQSSFPGIDGDSPDEEPFSITKRKKASQKARKYAKRTGQAAKSVDVTPFRALHLDAPTSHDEAKEMALTILAKQKEILLVFTCTFVCRSGLLNPLCLVVVLEPFSSRITLECVQEKLHPYYCY
jgi:hypothetical protein